MSSCSSSKSVVNTANKTVYKVDGVVANALQYKGVRYKYGGTTRAGMDCSGLIYVAFGSQNIQLPRVSRDMANFGREIAVRAVKKGDLLFFRTNKNNNNINHVGLVVSHKNGLIRFVHASTSRGVIVSTLSEKYWKNAFVKATKVL